MAFRYATSYPETFYVTLFNISRDNDGIKNQEYYGQSESVGPRY